MSVQIFKAGLLLFSLSLVACQSSQSELADFNHQNIVGGVEVKPEDPISSSTVVILQLNKEKTSTVYSCSGTLLKEDLVVTAAHCVFPNGTGRGVLPADRLFVYFGNLQSGTGLEAARVIDAEKVLAHPKFRNSFSDGFDSRDIALIKIVKPAPTPFRPASVLSSSVDLKKDQPVIVAGFGDNRDPKEQNSLILRKFEGYRVQMANENRFSVDLKTSPSRGSDHGDSGGPAFILQGEELKVWGVFSNFTFKSGTSSYEDIRQHKIWIEEASLEMGSEFQLD